MEETFLQITCQNGNLNGFISGLDILFNNIRSPKFHLFHCTTGCTTDKTKNGTTDKTKKHTALFTNFDPSIHGSDNEFR